MVAVLESHLAMLEREAGSRPGSTVDEQAVAVEDLAALHTAVYQRLERHLGSDGLKEAHRPLVPIFRRWVATARLIVAAARDVRAKGGSVGRLDDLVRSINLAKAMSEDFDHIVAVNDRLARGESPGAPEAYRTLAEVMDELHSKAQRAGSDAIGGSTRDLTGVHQGES